MASQISLSNSEMVKKLEALRKRSQEMELNKSTLSPETLRMQELEENNAKLKHLVLALKKKVEELLQAAPNASVEIEKLQAVIAEEQLQRQHLQQSKDQEKHLFLQQIHTLEERLEGRNQGEIQLLAQHEELRQRISSLTSDLKKAEIKIAELTAQKEESCNDSHHLKQEQLRLKNECLLLKGLSEQLQQTVKSLNERLKEGSSKLQESDAQKQRLEDEIKKFQEEASQAQEQHQKSKTQLSSLLQENERNKQAVVSARTQLDELRQKLSESDQQNQQHKRRVSSLLEAMQKRDERLAELQNVEQLAAQTQDQRNSFEKVALAQKELLEQKECTLQELQEHIVRLEKAIEEGAMHAKDLRAQLLSTGEALKQRNHEMQRAQSVLQTLKDEKDKHLQLLQNKITYVKELEEALILVKTHLNEALSSQRSLEERAEAAEKSKSDLLMQHQQAEEILQKQAQELELLSTRSSIAEARFATVDAELAEMKIISEGSLALNSSLKAELTQSKNIVAMLDEEKRILLREKESLRSHLEEALETEISLKTSLQAMEAPLLELESLRHELSKERTQHESTLNHIQDNYQSVLDQLEVRVQEMSKTMESVRELQEEKLSLQASYDHLLLSYNELVSQVEIKNSEQTQLQEQLLALAKHNEEIQLQLNEKLSQFDNNAVQHRRMQDELALVRRQMKEREAHMQAAQRHLAKKLKETTILQATLEQQKIYTLELQNRLNDHKAEVNELALKEALAQEKAKSSESLAKHIEAELETTQKKFQDAQQTLEENAQKIRHFEKIAQQHEKLQSDHRSLQGVFNSIKSSLGNLGTMESPGPALKIDEERPTAPAPAVHQQDFFGSLANASSAAVKEDLFY